MKQLSRRNFLRKSAMAASVAPVAFSQFGSTFIRSVRAGEPGPNDKIRLGVIGCGGQGKVDLGDFLKNQEVDCAVICDLDPERVSAGSQMVEKARGKKPETTNDFRRVLDRKDVDIVLVATP